MKKLEKMSSEDLYALARQREEEERAAGAAAAKASLQALRTERRALLQRQRAERLALDKTHAKELEGIEERIAELEALFGIRPSHRAQKRGRKNQSDVRSGDIEAVMEPGRLYRLNEIREALVTAGKNAAEDAHLSQRVNYLRKTGRIFSPERGMYGRAA